MIALIDADSILYLSLPKKDTPEQTYEECCLEIDNRINGIIEATKADKYALFITQGKCFRYKNYKANKGYKYSRQGKQMPPIFYALREYLKQQYGAYVCADLEADDLVTYFHNNIEEKTIICSPDKDVLKQNVGVHFDYKKNKRIAVSEKEADYFLFLQLGMGDSVDGISGIEGVGEKTVEKWFKEVEGNENISYASLLIDKYIEKYGIHEGIYKYFEVFTMVYMLKTDDDMLREIGYIPEFPTFRIVDKEEKEEKEMF
jgi:5'-3' exonuclease